MGTSTFNNAWPAMGIVLCACYHRRGVLNMESWTCENLASRPGATNYFYLCAADIYLDYMDYVDELGHCKDSLWRLAVNWILFDNLCVMTIWRWWDWWTLFWETFFSTLVDWTFLLLTMTDLAPGPVILIWFANNVKYQETNYRTFEQTWLRLIRSYFDLYIWFCW